MRFKRTQWKKKKGHGFSSLEYSACAAHKKSKSTLDKHVISRPFLQACVPRESNSFQEVIQVICYHIDITTHYYYKFLQTDIYFKLIIFLCAKNCQLPDISSKTPRSLYNGQLESEIQQESIKINSI